MTKIKMFNRYWWIVHIIAIAFFLMLGALVKF